jgi:predicted RNase H-like nuclease
MATSVLTKKQIDSMLMPTFSVAEQAVYFQEMRHLITVIEKTDKSIQLYKIVNKTDDNDPYIQSKQGLREEFVNKLAALMAHFNIHFQPMQREKNGAPFMGQLTNIPQAA